MIFLLLAFLQLHAQAPKLLWKAGIAKTVITPKDSIWMAGYAHRDHEAEGALHDIWVKALAIEDAKGVQAIFVSTDLLGLPRNISEVVCRRLQTSLGLERSQILLTSSHTHTGPVLRNSLMDIYDLKASQLADIEAYSQRLEDWIVRTVEKAVKRLSLARLSVGSGVIRFAINRRNNTESEIHRLTAFRGPVDHSVPVIKISKPNGKIMGIVFGYACHATCLSFYQWSGDYPGFAQMELEKMYPGATALFFAGCGADQNPLPRRTVALAQQYGTNLADAVKRVLDEPMKPLNPQLHTQYAELKLRLSAPPSPQELQAILQDKNAGKYSHKWASRWLKQVEAGAEIPTHYPYYPVQSWQLGDQILVALGGEVVVDYAIRLKRIHGQDLMVIGYANDVMAYIPSVRVLREGGYEGKTSMQVYGLPSSWDARIEEEIVAEVSRQLRE